MQASLLRPAGDGGGRGNEQRKAKPLGPGHPSVPKRQKRPSRACGGPAALSSPPPLWSEFLQFGVFGDGNAATCWAREMQCWSPLLSAQQEHPSLRQGSPGRPGPQLSGPGPLWELKERVLSLHGQDAPRPLSSGCTALRLHQLLRSRGGWSHDAHPEVLPSVGRAPQPPDSDTGLDAHGHTPGAPERPPEASPSTVLPSWGSEQGRPFPQPLAPAAVCSVGLGLSGLLATDPQLTPGRLQCPWASGGATGARVPSPP